VARAEGGDAWTDLDLVFTDGREYPHSDERVRLSFYKLLKQAGVQRVVLYSLRHAMATLVLADSKDLKLVASRLGHTSEHLVLNTYQHLLPGADRAAADRLGRFLSGDDDAR
jgi:integrase